MSESSTFSMLSSENLEEDGITVTVIGGGGFLGQHLVKLLHQHGYNISLIRVLDFFPFKPELDYQPIRTVQSIIGSVTCMEDVLVATTGATTVFHLASYTDRSMFPDEKLFLTINVEGTSNVIRACQLNGVQNLIYASDIAVVMGRSSIVRGDENTTAYPRVHLMPDGRSKALAEKMVIDACGTPTNGNARKSSIPAIESGGSGQKLKTVALRLVNLYGELDSFLWPRLISLGVRNSGYIPCVGNLKTKIHMMYVGNAAWAFVCAHDVLTHGNPEAWRALNARPALTAESSSISLGSQSLETGWERTKSKQKATHGVQPQESESSVSVGFLLPTATNEPAVNIPAEGKAYFVCDETPPVNYFVFMRSFLYRYGFFLTSWALPEKWAKGIFKLVRFILWLLQPFILVKPPLSEGDIHQLCRHYTFSSKSARGLLHYKPIYTSKRSLKNTLHFYDSEYKKAMAACLIRHLLGSQHVSIVRRMSQIKKEIRSVDLGEIGNMPRNRNKKN